MYADTVTVVVGACEDRWQAQDAVDELRRAGFREQQIALATRDQEDVAPAGVSKALQALGLSQEESEFYRDELEAGRTLVTVEAEGRERAAQRILERHRSHIANLRSTQGFCFLDDEGPRLVGMAHSGNCNQN
ncbi:MAG: hypothetical protein ACJ8FY_12440 [Gemmataceae bacterium]